VHLKGLIIAEPWVSHILAGTKTWEMRNKRASHRGPIALIQKGSSSVVGIANLVDVRGPLSESELANSYEFHMVPTHHFLASGRLRWNFAWVLEGAEPLTHPVLYAHPAGAMTWVKLPIETSHAISAALRSGLVK
jgi:hypothetical protein